MKCKLEDMVFTKPPMLHFEVEDRCNMSCSMCVTKNHRTSHFDRLTISEITHVVLAGFRFAGGRRLGLSGGEPTLSEDLEDILKYGVRMGFSILLSTNLYQVNPQRMRQILEIIGSSRHKIIVSYDSVHPTEVKKIRGVDARHEVTANLETLLQIKKSLGAKTNITACLTLQEENCRSVADTVNFLTRFDLNRIFVKPVNLYGEINETNFHQVRAPFSRANLPALLEAVELVFRMARENGRIGLSHPDIERWRRHFLAPATQQAGCRSDEVLFVSRHGDYRGCNQSKVFANIREIGMVDFLKSEKYMEHRRLITKCNICISECS